MKCIFVLAIVFLAGCNAAITGRVVSEIPRETNKNPEVYFCPKDDCGRVLEKLIGSANSNVHCAFYAINLDSVIKALSRKSRLIDVKVVVDGTNSRGQIKGEGMKTDDERQLMHNKFCAIDNKIVVTGSFNPTETDNYYNDNNMVVVYSEILAKNYEDEFNELWNGEFGIGNAVQNPVLHLNGNKVENYFCPEDGCASRIIKLIENAKSSVYFLSFTFTNEKIADALLKKDGIDIRGVVDSSQSFNKFSQFKRLNEFGTRIKKDTSKYKMHHKVFIIDNETVVTGSFNPTVSADTKNDENVLILHDDNVADAYLKEFDRIWNG